MTTTEVPVIIEPEAQALAEQLGGVEAMHSIIDHMKAIAPALQRIEVSYHKSPWDPLADPQVFLEGIEPSSARDPQDLSLEMQLTRWVIQTFPMEITANFIATLTPKGEG